MTPTAQASGTGSIQLEPIDPDHIYLDHNATAPLDPQVLQAMLPHLTDFHGNSLSGHAFGRPVLAAIEHARLQVAQLIGADPHAVIFTSGGSEAINFAIKGLAFANLGGPRRILYGATEHHAVEDAAHWLERFGFRAEALPVDEAGQVRPETLEKALQGEPVLLVAVMWANNEVGTIQPVEALGRLCRRAGVPFLCDAVQAGGKVPLSVEWVDLLALASHKFYGPKGVGALYVRPGIKLEPLIHGAQHEQGRRAGTHPAALVVGMGAAAALAQERLNLHPHRLERLRDRLQNALLARIPGTSVFAQSVPRLPNTLAVSFEGVPAWELQPALDQRGVAISAGAACRSGLPRPSPILMAMGIPEPLALGGVRLSLGHNTTEEQVDAIIERVVSAVEAVRAAHA